jgi:glycosyltransferase involved in cell wall biosynthesis
MRITIILGPFLPVPTALGGAVEKVHLVLARAYAAAGHTVTVISLRYRDLPHDELVDGVRHIRVPSFDRASSLARNLVSDLRYALRAARALPPSDITITNSFSLPVVLPRRRAGKIYVHVARFPKRQTALYFKADRLQAISQAVADAIVAQSPGLADRVISIGYPVPEPYFQVDPERSRPRTVLFVGRIAREKGVDVLLRAFASATKPRGVGNTEPWKLRVVGPHEVAQGGDGAAYADELKALADRLGAVCEFVGPIFNQEALIAEYQAASVFVYPSLAERGEAFGLAPLEAMAAGCAVVVSGLRCFDDFIADGVSGLKFDHRGANPERSLAKQLLRLAGDQALRDRIAAGGQLAARSFQVPAIARRMLDDFASLMEPRGI